jgi:hypothetical protein
MISGDDIEAMIGAEYWTPPEKDDGWRGIETAPKDGKMVLGAWQCLNKTWDMDCMFWFEEDKEGSWFDYHADCTHQPTHWMPLPEPPRK